MVRAHRLLPSVLNEYGDASNPIPLPSAAPAIVRDPPAPSYPELLAKVNVGAVVSILTVLPVFVDRPARSTTYPVYLYPPSLMPERLTVNSHLLVSYFARFEL